MGRPWTAVNHLCLSYRDEDECRTLLAINLLVALERGEKVVFFSCDTSVDVIHTWLRGVVDEVELLVARGQVAVRPANGFSTTNGKLDDEHLVELLLQESGTAARAGYTGLRVSMPRTCAPGDSLGWARLLEHEERLTELLVSGELARLTLACQYDQRLVPDRRLGELRQAHPIALTAEQAGRHQPLLRTDKLRGRTGLRLSGEINRSNLAELSAALESSIQDDNDLHLDLADLHYADVAAVRLLVQTADGLPEGRRIVLSSPGPIVKAILRIYDWDQLPTVRLLEGSETP
ncbi:MEDS domain-containing protein [Allokutzneria oryzae]|uniref:MEDS domain-containing protein n=1 Tax=Allokutzneria oryzae TaxID=1378989 RepID=A0ABV6A7H6_9PSEU